MKFFDHVEDVNFKVRIFTALSGAWLLINFIAQLPLYFSLWGSEDHLILSRLAHGPQLPKSFDLLSYYPAFSALAFIAVLIFSLGMIVGRTNMVTRTLTWYLVFLLDAKAWTVLDGGNNLIHLTLFYSIFFDYSFGSSESQTFIKNLAVRAVQIQLALVYGCAFFSKIGGELWQNGTALYYVVQVDKFQSSFLLNLFKNYPVTSPLLSYATILIQLILATCLWFKNWRVLAIILGTVVHIGIATSMGLIAFSLVMIAHYSIFLTRSDIKESMILFKQKFQLKPALVLTVFSLVTFKSYSTTNSQYFSSENLEVVMGNLGPQSKILIYSSAGNAELIERNSVSILDNKKLAHTEIEYGSITKLMTALKILEAEKAGLLSRDDLVLGNITLNDLLFHTSGVKDVNAYEYKITNDRTRAYSNANYALAGQYYEKMTNSSLHNRSKFQPVHNSLNLINLTNRPDIKFCYKSAYGIVGTVSELQKVFTHILLSELPCKENGQCWGGFRKGGAFISIGKLSSGTTLGRVDAKGNVLIVTSNDHSINLENLLPFISL